MGGEGGGSVIVGLSTVAFVCWCRKGAEGCVEGRVRVVGGSPYAGGRQICGEEIVKKAAAGNGRLWRRGHGRPRPGDGRSGRGGEGDAYVHVYVGRVGSSPARGRRGRIYVVDVEAPAAVHAGGVIRVCVCVCGSGKPSRLPCARKYVCI